MAKEHMESAIKSVYRHNKTGNIMACQNECGCTYV